MNLYQSQPTLKEHETIIRFAFEDEGKACVELEETLFHPKGGGQKSDRGVLVVGGREIPVLASRKDENAANGTVQEIDYPVDDLPTLKGQKALCKIDWAFRFANMRLHSAAHLHHCMMEKVLGQKLENPKSSTIEDGHVINRYENPAVTQAVADKAFALLCEAVQAGAPVTIKDDPARPGISWWECLTYRIPCGGTHVKDLRDIGTVTYDFAVKKKQASVRILLENKD